MTRFPNDFIWGTATAAHQIEGGNVNSDFWLAENVPETIFREPSGDACDSLHRYPEDIALAAKLGFNTHRFGIEWARIEPEPGVFSRAALDHYLRVLECCHAHGLAPMVSLNHWTVPRWFAARGGFERDDSPDLFARFAEQVSLYLGDGMAFVTTFNEANIQRVIGSTFHNPKAAPGLAAMKQACAKACGSDRFSMVLFATAEEIEAQLVEAHHRAAQALRAGPGSFQLGVTISMAEVEGLGEGNQAEAFENDLYGPWLDVAKTADFVGVQTYTRYRIGPEGRLRLPADAVRTDMGYEYRPEALEATVRFAARRIGRPIIVTEHGIAAHDDARRVALIDTALEGLQRCLDDGIDLRGYVHWSLLDNFEWVLGYAMRFGLIEVDRTTFAQTPKPSARHLGQIARSSQANAQSAVKD